MMLNFKFAVRRNGLLIINLISDRLSDFSSIAKKWKFCRIYWKRTLVEQTSLYTLVYRIFLYNEMNRKPPKKAPCGSFWKRMNFFEIRFSQYCYSNRQNKINYYYFFICGCYDSGHDVCGWRANRLANYKPLFSDSGQSIYLALRHLVCETAALRTAAQSIASKNFYKILAEGFVFVLS